MCSRDLLFLYLLLLSLGLAHYWELIVCCGLVLCLFVIVYYSVVDLCFCTFGCSFGYSVFLIFLGHFGSTHFAVVSDFFTDVEFFAGQLSRCPFMNLYPLFQQSGILLLFGGVGSMVLLCVCFPCFCMRFIPFHWDFVNGCY